MRNNQIKTSNAIDGQGDHLEALNSEQFKKYKATQDKEMNNYLSLFFGEVAENTPGTLKMIYQDPSTVPFEIRVFWNTFSVEYLPGARKPTSKNMIDYELFKTSDFCRELSEALGLRHVRGLEIHGDITEALTKNVESFKKKGYVITKDNYIKILKIVQRSLIRIPVIICGDTGCGKTHIVDFIASCLLEDEFRCFTLHAGVTEEQFVTRLAKYFEEARSLQTSEKRNNLLKCKKMWILIDEFNTSTLQEHFVELMKDRTSTLSDLLQDVPHNVVFIGCCNPYMIMEQGTVTNEEDIGYIAESSTKNLSHKVFPISDSLLSYLLDFGQLKSEDEKKYVREMIKNKRGGHISSELNCVQTNPDDVEELILAIIVNCQSKIREFENASAASLRDIARFLQIFEFFEKWGKALTIQEVAAMSCMITYLLRLRSEVHKKQIISLIQKSIKDDIKGMKDLPFNIEGDFYRISGKIAKQALELYGDEGSDISVNKPLIENLVVLLTGVSL